MNLGWGKVAVAVALAAGAVGFATEPALADDVTWDPVTGAVTMSGSPLMIECIFGHAFAVFPGQSSPPVVPCSQIRSISIVGTTGPDQVVVSGPSYTFPLSPTVDVITGEGDDTVTSTQTFISADLGAGNDRLLYNVSDFSGLGDNFADMGSGNDVLTATANFASTSSLEFFGYLGSTIVAGDGGTAGRAWSVAAQSTERLELFRDSPYGLNFGQAMRDTYVYFEPGREFTVELDLDTRGRQLTRSTVNGQQSLLAVAGTQGIEVAHPPEHLFVFPYNGRPVEYVDEIFWTFLGRPADDDGLFYWYDLLESGLPRETFVATMLRLPEHAGLAVDQAYADILGRGTDPAGRAYWSDFLQRGGPLDDLRALLYGSPEYFQRFGGNTTGGFFDALYSSVLHRSPDPAGRAYWTGLLNQGMSRVQVSRAILVLPEPIRVAIVDLYHDLLGRFPGPAELNYWQTVWQGHGEFLVKALLAGSQEYYDLVAPVDP